MLVGYARVSKNEQHLDLQIDDLKKAGCEKIFTDKITSLKEERKGLNEALAFLRPGDILVVWKLDRLGRTLRHLIDLIESFNKQGIGFKSLKETIDTTTSTGKLIFHIFGALAEFERDIIHERTNAGLDAARARGRKGGRPRSLNAKKVQTLKKLYTGGEHSIPEICQMLGISKTTLYRYVRPEEPSAQTKTEANSQTGDDRAGTVAVELSERMQAGPSQGGVTGTVSVSRHPTYQIYIKHVQGPCSPLPNGFSYIDQHISIEPRQCPIHRVFAQTCTIAVVRQHIERLKMVSGITNIWPKCRSAAR